MVLQIKLKIYYINYFVCYTKINIRRKNKTKINDYLGTLIA